MRFLIVIFGCKCATSINAALKSRTVRAGQVSIRQKMAITTTAMMRATTMNAIGQAERRGRGGDSAFIEVGNIEHPISNVERMGKFRRSIFALFPAKKIPPPMPDGHEGRLFPPEHFLKLSNY